MIDAAEYGREWAHDYDEGEDAAYALGQAHLIDSLAKGGPILEVAAGTGRVACRLKSPDVTATDASAAMLAVLSSKSSTVKTRIEVLPEVCGGPYEVIAILANSLWVMIEAEEQKRFFLNAAHALNSGGYLVVEHARVDVTKWDDAALTNRGIRTVIYSTQFQRAQLRFQKNGVTRHTVIRWTTDDEMRQWAHRAGLRQFSSKKTAAETYVDVWQKD